MKSNFIIYGLLIFYLIINTFLLVPAGLSYYNFINPFIWVAIFSVSYYLSNDSNLRIKGEKDKTQSLLIAMIVYIIVYFLSGLFFGFERTPYSKNIVSIVKNLWAFGSVVVFQEYIREALIKNERKSVINFVCMTLLFAILDINLSNISSQFVDVQSGFIFISTTVIPAIVSSAIMTYLIYISGAKSAIIYRLFILVPPFIVPIIPNYDWFGSAIMGITVPLGVYVYMNYVHVSKSERLSRRERRKYNPAVYVPVFVFIAVLAGFVIGIFKYQPIAVLSGSMSPTFNRGDAVVIQKLNTQEKDKLKKGDIIQFVSGTKYVVHRINDITNDEYGNKLFITKGDHNNTIDYDKVHLENVKGKVAAIIPFIGYPSVWLSGAIS